MEAGVVTRPGGITPLPNVVQYLGWQVPKCGVIPEVAAEATISIGPIMAEVTVAIPVPMEGPPEAAEVTKTTLQDKQRLSNFCIADSSH